MFSNRLSFMFHSPAKKDPHSQLWLILPGSVLFVKYLLSAFGWRPTLGHQTRYKQQKIVFSAIIELSKSKTKHIKSKISDFTFQIYCTREMRIRLIAHIANAVDVFGLNTKVTNEIQRISLFNLRSKRVEMLMWFSYQFC